MVFPRRAGTPRGGSSGTTSIILLLTVSMGSFFAGTLLTLHTGIGNCHSNGNSHPLAQSSQQVEEQVQRRMQGMYK